MYEFTVFAESLGGRDQRIETNNAENANNWANYAKENGAIYVSIMQNENVVYEWEY